MHPLRWFFATIMLNSEIISLAFADNAAELRINLLGMTMTSHLISSLVHGKRIQLN